MASRSIFVICVVALAQAAQLKAPAPVAAPLRELPWGQINFLHTTDTHGWHAGHLKEAQYGADWGDYISFAEHLRAKADADGTDLLLVDTGDRVDGNGLYDASDPKGKYTREIFGRQHIDIITTGNHELYQADTSRNEYEDLVPRFKGNYLASNLDYIRPDGRQVPMAQRYKKFTTKNQGIRIVAFGFVYDFHRNSNDTVVTDVEEVVKKDWFLEAIQDRDVDLFVVAGHVALDQVEYKLVYEAIRKEQWDTPIQFFAGHAHVRGYKVYDSKSHALASGRYFETVGFQSLSGVSTSKGGTKTASVTFGRRYIDNNLFSYYHHSGKNSSTFATEAGQLTTAQIAAAREELQLDETFGCVPRTLWTNRAPYPHRDSVYSWLATRVFPEMVIDPARVQKPRIIIGNTGGVRFDVFQGPFTRDTRYIISPFPGSFRAIEGMPFKYANRVLELLNNLGEIMGAAARENGLDTALCPQHALGLPTQQPQPQPQPMSPAALVISDDTTQKPLVPVPNGSRDNDPPPALIPGYTTRDDLGADGDDTVHAPIQFYNVPNAFESRINLESPAEKVDLVFLDFVQPYVLAVLQFLGAPYAASDTRVYLDQNINEVLTEWVKKNWKGDC